MTINCKGKLIDLSIPRIMGILNVTPDSFYDGGRYKNEKDILSQVERMLNEGATFIDIGAYSTKPGAKEVSEAEELHRLLPIIELVLKEFPETLISVDSFRSAIATQAIAAGACMVNDISAGHLDATMLTTVAKLKVPFIMMHTRGTPKTMQQLTHYDDLIKDILSYFAERISKAKSLGLIDLIIDPGFGFAKNLKQNFELLNHLECLNLMNLPILVGVSRKSMIYNSLKSTADEALNGTTVLNTIALQKGANILRVHDVKHAKECILLTQQMQ